MQFKLSSVVEEPSGKVSSIRILSLVWGIGVFVVWAAAAIISVVHGVYVFPPIPESVVTVLVAAGGMNVVQRFAENPLLTDREKPATLGTE
jgi:CHASE2 domain-containing sensor protein